MERKTVTDAAQLSPAFARRLSNVETAVGRLAGPDGKPRVVKFIAPSNGRAPQSEERHVLGAPEMHMYDSRTGTCSFVDRNGQRCAEDHRNDPTAPAVAPAEDLDDVGDGPPTDAQLREWEAARNG